MPVRRPRHFLDETRLLRDALGQLVTGTLAGLFDDHTNIDVDWRAPIQSLSLSRLEPLGDEAVGIALTCLNSWGRGMREVAAARRPADRGARRVVEAAAARASEAVKSFDADLRLSRTRRRHPVRHRPQTLRPALRRRHRLPGRRDRQGPAAPGRHQDPARPGPGGRRANSSSMLGLGPIAADLVTGWAMQGKGRALWCVGEPHYKVQTVLHPLERT